MPIFNDLIASLKRITADNNENKVECCDLFGGGDGQEYAFDADTGRWITVHPNGAKEGKGRKIHLDESGKIDSKGPLSEAIKAKGEGIGKEAKPITAYHAGDISIADYDMDKAEDKLGIYFSEKQTNHYGKQDEYEIRPKNKLVVHQGEEYKKYLLPRAEEGEKDESDVRKRLLKDGYDCVEIRYIGNHGDVVDFVALDKSIIHKKGEGDGDNGIRKSISDIYTGSSADYHQPSLIHVGSGEGSQVYGWGLYGSTERGVAEVYADAVTDVNGAVELKGKLENFLKELGYSSEEADYFADTYFGEKFNCDKALKEIGEYDDGLARKLYPNRNKIRDFISGNRAKHSNIYSQTFFTNRAEGDESHLLNWYEPVSKENVKRISDELKKERKTIGIDLDRLYANYDSMTHIIDGQTIYQKLVENTYSPQAASKFLARADIDGVKYPVDSYGKTVKDGNKVGWNYVSFRDDNITIDRKFVDGKEVPVANTKNQTKAMVSALKDWIPSIDVGEVEEDKVTDELGSDDNIRKMAIRQEEYDKWNAMLDKYENGTMTNSNAIPILAHTPIVLQRIGMNDLPICISKRTIDKITGEILTKSGEFHKVPVSELRNLQIEMDNPIAVFDSRTDNGSKVILTRIVDKENNEKAVVALKANVTQGAIEVNSIASVYGKDKDSIDNWISWGMLRYVNKQARKSSAKWLQLPGDSDLRAHSVLTENDFSNEQLGHIIPNNSDEKQGGIRKSLIMGERGAEMLANNANIQALQNLKVAKQMLGDKAWETMPRDEKVKIKLATGWEKGKDGKWRRESIDISDSAIEDLKNGKETNVGKIIGDDSEIANAYPQIKGVKIKLNSFLPFYAAGATVKDSTTSSHIEMNPSFLRKEHDIHDIKDTIAHEIQHVIQHYEGFSGGADIRMFHDIDNTPYDVRRRIHELSGECDLSEDLTIRALKIISGEEGVNDIPNAVNAVWRQLFSRAGYNRSVDRTQMARELLNGIQEKGETAFSQYRRVAGEVEARNAGGRTEADRNAIGKELLEDTEDVAREDQMVISEAENAINQSIAFSNAGASKQPIHGEGGKVAGWYDRNTGKVRLVKGVATPSTVAHEIGWHATFHWAEKNHPELHKKLIQYAKEAPEGIEQSVKEKYGTKLTPNELLDEIGAERFTRQDISPLLQEAQKRASEQFFDRVENEQDNLRKAFVGASKALSREELDEIAAQEPKKAVEMLVQKMLEGRTLGVKPPFGGNDGGGNGGNGKKGEDSGIRLDLVGRKDDGTEMYETNALLKTLDKNARIKHTANILAKQFVGQNFLVGENGDGVNAGAKHGDISKIVYNTSNQQNKGRWHKIDAIGSGDLSSIVNGMLKTGEESDKKENGIRENKMHRGVDAWKYYTKKIVIDGVPCKAIASVRSKGDAYYLYNVRIFEIGNNQRELTVPTDQQLASPGKSVGDGQNSLLSERTAHIISNSQKGCQADDVKKTSTDSATSCCDLFGGPYDIPDSTEDAE